MRSLVISTRDSQASEPLCPELRRAALRFLENAVGFERASVVMLSLDVAWVILGYEGAGLKSEADVLASLIAGVLSADRILRGPTLIYDPIRLDVAERLIEMVGSRDDDTEP